MLTVEEARQQILLHAEPVGLERLMILQAQGRVLAEDIVSPLDNPAFHNSAMDGYAVRWNEVAARLQGEEVILPLSMEVPAGTHPEPLPPGSAARIMTGAEVPEGADTVIMREDTEESEDAVRILSLPQKGQGAHIRLRGENIQAGSLALSRGTLLQAGEIGLLATFGKALVSVHRKPRVAVISTGDELVDLGETPGPGKIVNSGAYSLCALIASCGADPVMMPIARDTLEDTRKVFSDALECADVVVSIGGVSVGDYDVVKVVMKEMCGDLDFWKVRMKPGKPLAFGRTTEGGTRIIGLPGNPVSAYVSFWQFVRPLLGVLSGGKAQLLPTVKAVLHNTIRSTPKRLEFVRGSILTHGGQFRFDPCKGQGSGNPMSAVKIDALGRIPIGCSGLKQGEEIEVELLPWWS